MLYIANVKTESIRRLTISERYREFVIAPRMQWPVIRKDSVIQTVEPILSLSKFYLAEFSMFQSAVGRVRCILDNLLGNKIAEKPHCTAFVPLYA